MTIALPASFSEYLLFTNTAIPSPKEYLSKQSFFVKKMNDYLWCGGFPQAVFTRDESLLKQYFTDIVEKDIIGRYAIREKKSLKALGVYLMTNSAKIYSMSSAAKTFDIARSVAGQYIDYYRDVFLLYDVPQFSFSLKTQQKALRKIYAGDTGLARAVSFRFSKDLGSMIETLVFLELRRRKNDVYYFKKQTSEADFIIKKNDDSLTCIQVSENMRDEKVRARELRGVRYAIHDLGVKKAVILTVDDRGEEKIGDVTVQIMPIFQWLLGI